MKPFGSRSYALNSERRPAPAHCGELCHRQLAFETADDYIVSLPLGPWRAKVSEDGAVTRPPLGTACANIRSLSAIQGNKGQPNLAVHRSVSAFRGLSPMIGRDKHCGGSANAQALYKREQILEFWLCLQKVRTDVLPTPDCLSFKLCILHMLVAMLVYLVIQSQQPPSFACPTRLLESSLAIPRSNPRSNMVSTER
ncbi:hypothetical protein CC78DRAFT_583838 [Lojkania enalia]|uniref:Uncharacterized protein n=1 Tax=Lojkania enalia TaxID=147567 RepID=A0A9P4K363_9PLEO|nr:hypothetical protein CC78DRAFT_583838 [Didymosphaeria enalia]